MDIIHFQNIKKKTTTNSCVSLYELLLIYLFLLNAFNFRYSFKQYLISTLKNEWDSIRIFWNLVIVICLQIDKAEFNLIQ